MDHARELVFYKHPLGIFTSTAFGLSIFALMPMPSMLPMALLLSTLIVYFPVLIRSEHRIRNGFLLLVSLAFGRSLTWLLPSLHALDTPVLSLLVLFLMSAVSSLVALSIIFTYTFIRVRFQAPGLQVLLFPALWATAWCGVSYISPIGRLALWSPVLATEPYSWLLPLLGPVSLDYVTALWAVGFSQAVELWFMGGLQAEDDDHEPLITIAQSEDDERGQKALPSQLSNILRLGIMLIVLPVPSFFISDLPSSVVSENATPLTVGCVLPPRYRYKHHRPTLKDYIDETKKLNGHAQILLWPESAVSFRDESERDGTLRSFPPVNDNLWGIVDAFREIRKVITGSYVGVSYEETSTNPGDPSGRTSIRQNGMSLISSKFESPHLVYYKRHLVPSEFFCSSPPHVS